MIDNIISTFPSSSDPSFGIALMIAFMALSILICLIVVAFHDLDALANKYAKRIATWWTVIDVNEPHP